MATVSGFPKVLVSWLVVVLKGTIWYAVVIYAARIFVAPEPFPWAVMFLGVPSHWLAHFAGFLIVAYRNPLRRQAVLGTCYLGLLFLSFATGLIFGLWAGLLVFIEAWLIGLPGGHRDTLDYVARATI